MRRLAAALCASALLAGCGSGRSSARHRQAAAASAIPTASCVSDRGFGGIGGSVNAFDANNNNSTGPAEPTPGAAWYEVTGTFRGCVTAYSVHDSATPPLQPRDLILLVSHGYLPKDAQRVMNTDSCAIWHSYALQHAVGLPYAKATAVAQDWTVPGTAHIEATSSPAC